MVINAERTIQQIEADAASIGHGAEESAEVRSLISKQREAIDAYSAIRWSSDGTPSGVLAGKAFADRDGFFKIINRIQKKIENETYGPDYWEREAKKVH
jgi:hypothetical protein